MKKIYYWFVTKILGDIDAGSGNGTTVGNVEGGASALAFFTLLILGLIVWLILG